MASPYGWAAARSHAISEHDRSLKASTVEVIEALRSAGFPSASSAVAALARRGIPSITAAAPVADSSPADFVLAALITTSRRAYLPSVTLTDDGRPRFVVTSSDGPRLAAAIVEEFGSEGINPEMRLFLDAMLQPGDSFIDLAPDLGVAALSAATHPVGPRVAVHCTAPDARSSLEDSATQSNCRDRLSLLSSSTLDTEDLPALQGSACHLVHAGSAAEVTTIVLGARALIRQDKVGAIIWSRDNVNDAAAADILSAVGFSHFALSGASDDIELVPVHEAAAVVFSLADALLHRTHGVSPDAQGDAVEESLRTVATRFFDRMVEEVAPGAQLLGGIPTRGQLALADLTQVWGDKAVISFDVFDTLVYRITATPVDVFLRLSREEPFASLAFAPVDLAHARRRAEREARQQAAAARGTVEVTLAEIYECFATQHDLDHGLVPAMVASEQRVELAVCRKHPVMATWFERAVREGKTIWCLSDTYHDEPFLVQLLSSCGYDVRGVQIFVSSETGLNKSSGTLFHHVMSRTGTPVQAVLHIGDHPVGDDAQPSRLGIRTVLHPWASARAGDADTHSVADSTLIGLAQSGARIHEPAPPFWWRFGYSIAGPVLAGFASWVRAQLRQAQVDRAFFLLRDGEILAEVYGALFDAKREGQTIQLLESSRRAFVLPAYEHGGRAVRAQLLATENPRPVGEFLTRLGIAPQALRSAIRSSGFDGPEDVVRPSDLEAMRRVAALFSLPAVHDALIERSREERALLLSYLRQEGVMDASPLALVDIGWNATIQKSLVTLLQQSGDSRVVRGYYIGTSASASVGLQGGSAAGYLFENGEPDERAGSILQLPQLMEFICSSSRGSLAGFASHGGTVVAQHAPCEHADEQLRAHADLRAGAVAFATSLRESGVVEAVSPDAAMRRISRLISAPTFEEAEAIGRIVHAEGMTSNRQRHLAQFSSDAWHVAAINQAVDRAYWPAGLTGQRNAQALVLRTLHWLTSDFRE